MITQTRYHIQFNNRRTTITVDSIVSELLAVNFGLLPDHPDAHATVRHWLEKTLHDKLGENVPGGNRISQYARVYAFEELAKKRLMDRVWDWRLSQDVG